MPSAFDVRPLKITHDPNQRIDSYAGKLPGLDPLAIIEQWINFLKDIGFDAIKTITGIDLSTPEAFLGSLASIIINGGAAVSAFVEAIVSPIFAAIKALTGIDLGTVFNGLNLGNPGAVLNGITDSISQLVGGVIQQIIDAIVGAVQGTTSTLNDITALASALFNPMQLLQNVFGMIQAIADQLGGKSGGLDARISALEAAQLGASGLVSGDNFNRPLIGSTWTNIAGALVIGASDYVKSGTFSAAYYNVAKPSTDRYGVAVKLAARTPGDCSFFAFSDTSMSNYVAVRIHAGIFGDDSIALYTGSSPTVSVVHTQVDFVSNLFGHNSLNEGDVIALNYDNVTNTYTVSRNGSVVDGLTWQDSSNIVTHGPTKRENGIVSCVLNQTLLPGFGVTDFVYYDRTA